MGVMTAAGLQAWLNNPRSPDHLLALALREHVLTDLPTTETHAAALAELIATENPTRAEIKRAQSLGRAEFPRLRADAALLSD